MHVLERIFYMGEVTAGEERSASLAIPLDLSVSPGTYRVRLSVQTASRGEYELNNQLAVSTPISVSALAPSTR
jgi:hypothetical protein